MPPADSRSDATSNAPPVVAHDRLSGLSPQVTRLLDQAGKHLDRRDIESAEPLLAGARALAPDHPEVLRLWAVSRVISGRAQEAVDALKRALAVRPDDALLHNNLGSAASLAGDVDAALRAFRRASELAPNLPAAWYNLGKTLKVHGDSKAANEALERALLLAPHHVAARIVQADNLKALGRVNESEAAYRAALRQDPAAAHAWWGLANLKTVRFDAADAIELERHFARTDGNDRDRPALGFALAKALEDQDRYAEAFGVLDEANALRRRQQPWDAASFSREIDAIIDAFAGHTSPDATSTRGEEVIFIVSLPRAGSTLVEQIIASHPDVEGAGELPDLAALIDEESRRRGAPFPSWAGVAVGEDWRRLGERYLEHTRRWHRDRPRFTDKSLLNWQYVGAAAAMLPGARFVHCRRDAVETALSCYRQWFNQGQAFSYSIDDIAATWRDHERLMRFWGEQLPGWIRTQVHEALLADPESEVRQLLEFCRLTFDPRCLDFHRSERSVRTASAAQVREPLRRNTGRADRYGDLLDRLRRALGDS